MLLRHIIIAAACLSLFSCNSQKGETDGTITETRSDLARDGLKGNVKKYTHEEYKALQQGSNWQQANDTPIVSTSYTYDSTGNILLIVDAIQNGQVAKTKRVYKYAKDKPLVIVRYEGEQALSHTTRVWNNAFSYTDKSYHSFDKNDTTNWESMQTVMLNSDYLMDSNSYTLRTAENVNFSASSHVAYNADKSLRSRTIYSSGEEPVTINYSILSTDKNGNPTKMLKQYTGTQDAVLIVKSYEYY